jgi:hypothetical protein
MPMAELFRPRINSLSQCPGTARSSTSAGRSLIMISSEINDLFLPFHRAQGTHKAHLERKQETSLRRNAPSL